jgi:hypothetical protein
MAPIAGLYDPVSGQAGAIDVALFILIIGASSGSSPKPARLTPGSSASPPAFADVKSG